MNGTLFSKLKLPINQIMHVLHVWLCGASYTVAVDYFGYSEHTIVDYYKYFRNLVADAVDFEDVKIGGPGIVVQIDESKFGKRKNIIEVIALKVFGSLEASN